MAIIIFLHYSLEKEIILADQERPLKIIKAGIKRFGLHSPMLGLTDYRRDISSTITRGHFS